MRTVYTSAWNTGGRAGGLRAWNTLLKQWEHPPSGLIAANSAQIGEIDDAFAWLERAFHEHAFLADLNVAAEWDLLRSDPRFDDLLRRVGFSDLNIGPGVLAGTGKALALTGRPTEAIARLHEAMGLSPRDSRMARWLYYMALSHFAIERYNEVLDWGQRALSRDAGEYTTQDIKLLLASSYGHLDRLEEARAALNDALDLWPDFRIGFEPLPPYTLSSRRDRYTGGLIKAGLKPTRT